MTDSLTTVKRQKASFPSAWKQGHRDSHIQTQILIPGMKKSQSPSPPHSYYYNYRGTTGIKPSWAKGETEAEEKRTPNLLIPHSQSYPLCPMSHKTLIVRKTHSKCAEWLKHHYFPYYWMTPQGSVLGGEQERRKPWLKRACGHPPQLVARVGSICFGSLHLSKDLHGYPQLCSCTGAESQQSLGPRNRFLRGFGVYF